MVDGGQEGMGREGKTLSHFLISMDGSEKEDAPLEFPVTYYKFNLRFLVSPPSPQPVELIHPVHK